jgi:hypothetical protein
LIIQHHPPLLGFEYYTMDTGTYHADDSCDSPIDEPIVTSTHAEYAHDKTKMTISYVTDIEGNLDYWERSITLSKVINRFLEVTFVIMIKDIFEL